MQPVAPVAWFLPANYAAFRALDPAGLFPTFDEWLQNAEAGCQELERQGIAVARIDIDPDAFAAWCRETEIEPDAQARARFAVAVFEEARRN